MKKSKFFNVFFFIALLSILGVWLGVRPVVSGGLTTLGDTTEVLELNRWAAMALEEQDFSKSIDYAQKAFYLAQEINYTDGLINSTKYLAECYEKQGSYLEALHYHLYHISILEQSENIRALLQAELGLGFFYFRQEKYQQAIIYLEKGENHLELLSEAEVMASYKTLGDSYFQLKKYETASLYYEKLTPYYQKIANYQESEQNLNNLTEIYQKTAQWEQAIAAQKNLLMLKTNIPTSNPMVIHNNLGCFYQKKGERDSARYHFQEAFKIVQKQDALYPIILTNLAIALAQVRDYQQSRNLLFEALAQQEERQDFTQIAQLKNYLAAHHFYFEEYDAAQQFAEEALEIGININDWNLMKDSYQVLAKIAERKRDFEKSQKYFQAYTRVNDSLNNALQVQNQQLTEKQYQTEKEEKDLKLLIAEQEQQAMKIRQIQLEKERQEQDLKLQQQKQALLQQQLALKDAELIKLKNRELEEQQARNQLQIQQQQAEAEKQQQAIALLDKEKQLQEAKIKEQEIEEQTRKKTLLLQEQELKLREEKIENQKQVQRYVYIIAVFILLFLLATLWGWLHSRNINKKLAHKNQEIEAQRQEIIQQNQELQQNQEEILAQRDFIEQRNEELQQSQFDIEQKNQDLQLRDRQISSSIRAALTIQAAILPYEEKLNRLLGEHFILYRPKDIVSGDFYWINEVDQTKVLVVADCTGHGVPGALMTMIGNTLLDKIVRVWEITDPAQIITKLHEEIQIVLRQKETGNNYGMDLVVLSWQKNTSLTFAGAKNSLYYILPQDKNLQKIKGTRKSIGGEQNEAKVFRNEHLLLPKGARIYVGSDGLEDQNNPQRKRFGSTAIEKVLLQNAHLPMQAQGDALENVLLAHMQDSPQRDDILWLGMKI